MIDERDWLAERFREHRANVRAVAYRKLGSASEADDAVEALLRLSRAGDVTSPNASASAIEVPEAEGVAARLRYRGAERVRPTAPE